MNKLFISITVIAICAVTLLYNTTTSTVVGPPVHGLVTTSSGSPVQNGLHVILTGNGVYESRDTHTDPSYGQGYYKFTGITLQAGTYHVYCVDNDGHAGGKTFYHQGGSYSAFMSFSLSQESIW